MPDAGRKWYASTNESLRFNLPLRSSSAVESSRMSCANVRRALASKAATRCRWAGVSTSGRAGVVVLYTMHGAMPAAERRTASRSRPSTGCSPALSTITDGCRRATTVSRRPSNLACCQRDWFQVAALRTGAAGCHCQRLPLLGRCPETGLEPKTLKKATCKLLLPLSVAVCRPCAAASASA